MFSGYFGIVIVNLIRAISGDIISSIIAFIIIGQAMTVIGSYLKRVFMCLFLGVISPLIVAADVVVSTTGKSSTIFKNWLKNFSLTVFMQSIHAAYLVIAFSMIGKLYNSSALNIVENTLTGQELPTLNVFQVDIVVIVLMTGLVKLEKMIKTLFGIGDSFAGNLKEGAKSMVKAMGAVRGLKEGISAVSDNRKKATDAGKRKRALDKAIIDRESAMRASRSAKGDNINNGNQTTVNNNINNNNSSDSSESSGSEKKSKSSGDFIEDIIKEYNGKMTPEEELAALKKARDKEARKQNAGILADIMSIPNMAAGLGIGLGMGDEISESLFKGGYITSGLDWATEKVGEKATKLSQKIANKKVKIVQDVEVEYNVTNTVKNNSDAIPNSEVQRMVRNLDKNASIDDV